MTPNEKDRDPPPEAKREIEAVVARAKAGDQTVLPRLRALLTQYPSVAAHYGDLAVHAVHAWAALCAGSNSYLNECLIAQAAALHQELAGPAPSPVVQLLAERVVACWMQMNYFDAIEAQALKQGESPKLGAYRAKRQAQAHRHYLSAITALALLRRLVPAPVPALASVAAGHPPATGQPPAGAVDLHHRMAGFFDPGGNGVGLEPTHPKQEPCGVGSEG